jgi:hypothetical protein
MFDNISAQIGASNLAVQGIDYPASIVGFLEGGDNGGAQQMAGFVKTALQKCPGTKVVLSGYSQGGQLVHKAANMLDAATQAQINSGKSSEPRWRFWRGGKR